MNTSPQVKSQTKGSRTAPQATPSTVEVGDREACIRSRAYELYAQGGFEDGHAEEHWRQAEQEWVGSSRSRPHTNSPTAA